MELQSNSQHEETAGTILIVEDDQSTREFLKYVIETETPYKPLTVGSGFETLQYIEQVIKTKPILFILDYRLPTMTAIELYDHLHSHKALEQQPAIILTAVSGNKQIEQEAAKRHIEVVLKPFDLDELLHSIERALKHSTNRT